MQLKEREIFMAALLADFERVLDGEGHTVLVSGEAGIGKTALVRAFATEVKKDCLVLKGTCDALFTPRPLAPLLDVILQLGSEEVLANDTADRSLLFSRFLKEIGRQRKTVIIIFEDVHWADEASIDFIKFFARRVSQAGCLFLLTFRDNESEMEKGMGSVIGQLDPDSFTRLKLTPFSRETVEKLALEKGFDGKEVFQISGGNPFYVNEILASYSTGVPDKVKDSILSVFHRQEEGIKEAWKLLSVLPQGLPLRYGRSLEAGLFHGLEKSLASQILLVSGENIHFKHELYRRTIEVSLSPLVRLELNRRMLDLVRQYEPEGESIEQVIHFAKNANEGEVVVAYAPRAAEKAARVGAHIEASRLYMSAIEYYQGTDPATMLRFYEGYAYECYLTNRIDEAIIYTTKALAIWKNSGDLAATGNALRFLSRLWWYAGNNEKAGKYGLEAIAVFTPLAATPGKGMAFSNMSQLKMLSDDLPGCLHWGETAIAIARSIGDNSTLSHALNNVGTTKMLIEEDKTQGNDWLKQSLQIALDFGYHEHAARAYTNICSNAVILKDYPLASAMLEEGIRFCEERDLDSWSVYMTAMKTRLCLETGRWDEVRDLASRLLANKNQATVSKIIVLIALGTVRIRTGEEDGLPLLLEALELAEMAREPQRLIPALVALLEWQWINEKPAFDPVRLNHLLEPARGTHDLKKEELDFWLWLNNLISGPATSRYPGYQVDNSTAVKNAAAHWKTKGNSYLQALCLFTGNETEKRSALELVLDAGALATADKMKRALRAEGLKNIPRGIRKSTRENPLQLTGREIELLPLLRDGLQNKEIAARLFISPKTVDHHISSIYFKLDVKSRAAAVKEALRLRIID